jgi:hypothetical protein
MPQLHTYANLWTLWDHPAAGADEWSLARKVAAVRAAGFDGVMGDAGVGVGELARAEGLTFLAFARLDVADDFTAALTRCRDEGAAVVQVHLGWHDTAADTALAMAQRLMAAAHEVGIDAVIETHRDTCTETPEKTDALSAQFHTATGAALPLLYDFSHHAVVKHLQPPFAPRLLTDPDALRRARWFHLRPFNGHHAQIPVRSPNGTDAPEMADWWALIDALFALLRTSELPAVWVCPEIGPVRGGYGLAAFPPSWTQAVALRDQLVARWATQPATAPPTAPRP